MDNPQQSSSQAEPSQPKQRIDGELLDFHPDYLQTEYRPVPWLARSLLYVISAMLVIALLWASLAQVDRIVTAEGKLAPVSKPLVMQPLDRSVLKAINVREGEHVRKGQVLATLDPTLYGAESDSSDYEIHSYIAQLSRIDAELSGTAMVLPEATPANDRLLQTRLFEQRKFEYDSRMESFNKELNTLQRQIATKRGERASSMRQRDLSKKMLDMYEGALGKGAIAEAEYLRFENEDIDYRKACDRLAHEIQETEASIQKVEADKQAFVGNWRNALAQKRVEVQRELELARGRLIKSNHLKTLQELSAPADAIVLKIIDRSPGSVVNEAEPVISLVPIDHLEVQTHVLPRDIGFIRTGDPVRIKLEAFPFQKHGVINGTVKIISEDAMIQKVQGHEQAYYSCRIEITRVALDNVPDDFRLQPGMNVTAEIMVGKRRVISYFLYPLIRALDESMREP